MFGEACAMSWNKHGAVCNGQRGQVVGTTLARGKAAATYSKAQGGRRHDSPPGRAGPPICQPLRLHCRLSTSAGGREQQIFYPWLRLERRPLRATPIVLIADGEERSRHRRSSGGGTVGGLDESEMWSGDACVISRARSMQTGVWTRGNAMLRYSLCTKHSPRVNQLEHLS